MVNVETVIKSLSSLAPEHLAAEWDNVGLNVGDRKQSVKKIMIALTVDERLIEAALSQNIDLLITHHPLIFRPLKELAGKDPVQKMLVSLVKNDISLYVMHTNLDVVAGGVSDALAQHLGLETDSLKIIKETGYEELYKVVVFVPVDHHEKLQCAMFDAGAGQIGDYAECGYSMSGEGTFFPLEGADPYLGTKGKREIVEEKRFETIVPGRSLDKVLSAMKKAHPYEEVAYDVYKLAIKGARYGMGRYGKLSKSVPLSVFIDQVGGLLKGDTSEKNVSTVAVCGGSGRDLVTTVAQRGVDAYITGDITYHDELLASSLGLSIIDLGHRNSELPILRTIESYLKKLYDKSIDIIIYYKDAEGLDDS